MRRNWPDLLIGLALLLVIGGIIATLLNGGNILPFGRGATNPPATVSTSTTSESTATDPVTPTEANGGSSATTSDATTTDSTDGGIAAVDPNATTNDTVTMPAEQGGDGTITPVSPTAVEGDTPSPDAATAAVAAVAPDATETTTETATTDTDAATPAPTTEVASGSATAPYRISVGAFGSAENAERRAQAFRDAGYPVFTGNQGDLVIVLLGPYNSQAEAEQVKAELQSSGLEADPIIYEFTPNDAEGASSASDASTSDASASAATETAPSEEPATATATTAPATSSSGRYLQVGAYNSLESAAPQRTTLEGLGFTVSAVEEGSLVKLLVGPYDDSSIATAQSQLSAQGIESFVR